MPLDNFFLLLNGFFPLSRIFLFLRPKSFLLKKSALPYSGRSRKDTCIDEKIKSLIYITYTAAIYWYTLLHTPMSMMLSRHTSRHTRAGSGLRKAATGASLGMMYMAFTTSR